MRTHDTGMQRALPDDLDFETDEVSEYGPSEQSSPDLASDEDMSSISDQDINQAAQEDTDRELTDDEIVPVVRRRPNTQSHTGDSTPSNAGSSSGTTAPSNNAVVPKLYRGNLRPGKFYRERIEGFTADPYLKKNYKPRFTQALNRVLHTWREFCNTVRKPWLDALKDINLSLVESFIIFHLNQKRGKDHRRKRGTRVTRSLRTFWDNFRVLYRRETLSDLDWKLDRTTVNNLLEQCNVQFNLSDEKKDNRPMTLEDLKLQIEETLSTTEKAFKIGEQRILAVLYLLLLAPAGARPDSILKIQYKHIDIALHQPKKGPVQLVIYIRLQYTKSYLGSKGVKTFIVPEVLFDPSLFLSPHIFLLGILFRRRAFKNERLNDHPQILEQMRVPPSEMQLPIPLREDLGDDYLFRAVDRGVNGFVLSKSPLSYSVMNKTLQHIGRLLGFESNATAYVLRYMAGNNMNECVDLSNELQNLIMDHAPNSSTFQKNYLNRNITFDLWALHRGLNPQQGIVREAASFGYRRSTKRPAALSSKEASALKEHPEYKHYMALVDRQVRGTEAWRGAKRELGACLARLRRAATKDAIGKTWTMQYATEQIERQLDEQLGTSGATGGGSRNLEREQNDRPMSAVQQRMVSALHEPMQTTLKAQLHCRTEAINAIKAYCLVQEPLRRKLIEKQGPLRPVTIHLPPILGAEEVAQLRRRVTVEYEGQKLTACYICVGEALTLPPGDPNLAVKCHEFSSVSAVVKHFKTAHLRFMKPPHLPPCPICIPMVTFDSFMYLQSHAQSVHGILQAKLWTGEEVSQ